MEQLYIDKRKKERKKVRKKERLNQQSRMEGDIFRLLLCFFASPIDNKNVPTSGMEAKESK